MPTLNDEEQAILDLIARFVDKEVRPVVHDLEHNNTYPERLIEHMKDMGVFGLAIPEPYGDFGVSTACYAGVTEELARGWMSLAGAFGGHSVVSKLLLRFGTPEQRERYLPSMATGELRATMALTEPDGGSDLQAIRTVARRVDGGYLVNGAKTWITNARTSGLVALLCKTDPEAEPAHKGVSIVLIEKVPGFEISRDLPKLGYKGVESCELSFTDCFVAGQPVLGGDEGKGFSQMMAGLEVGRIQVAARAIGVARAASTMLWPTPSSANLGKPMGTPINRQLPGRHGHRHHRRPPAQPAGRPRVDVGLRADLEAGMAKLFVPMAAKVTLDAIRIHGGYGYSTEFDVERYFHAMRR